MKPVTKRLRHLSLLMISFLIMIAACKKDDTPDSPTPQPANPDGVLPDPTEQDSVPGVEESSADPNLVTKSLIFDNMTILEGRPPGSDSGKSMPVDLKIDADTIFWTPGYTQRIKFKKPEGVEIQNAWLYVPDSDSYIQADFRADESTGEIGILHFGFDSTSWELPVAFPIEIVALDPGGNPLDEFKLPVVIEKPFEEGGFSSRAASTDEYVWEVREAQNWYRKYTEDIPNDLYHAQYIPKKTKGETEGCCTQQGTSDPGGTCQQPLTLEYENVATTKLLKIILYPDGTVFGREDSVYKNLDVWNSDFCSNTAAYSETQGEGLTFELPLELYGSHAINGYVLKIENVSLNETQMGAGQFVHYKLVSPHFMIESLVGTPESPLPDGLGTTRKIYQKADVVFSVNDPLHDQPWFD